MQQIRFTPRQIDAFIATSELSSFSQAASRLHLTPSAISNLITQLEATLDFALFERSTRRVALSPAGREFLSAALAVQRQLRLASVAADDIKNRAVGIVRAAAPLAVASVILPQLIAAFQQKRPRVTIRILDTPVEWLTDRVATGEADLALGPDRAPGVEVRAEHLYPSPWVLWCAPTHPFAKRTVLRWSDLNHTPLCTAGHDHEHSVPQMREGPNRVIVSTVVDNISTALGLAAADIAAAVSPAYVEALARSLGLVMRRIVEPEVMRYMTLYSPMQRPSSPAALGFAEFLRAALDAQPVAIRKPE